MGNGSHLKTTRAGYKSRQKQNENSIKNRKKRLQSYF